MTMKPTTIFALIFLSTAAFSPVGAQTYQWKDSSGRTVISDTPPPASSKDNKVIGGKRPVTTREYGGDIEVESKEKLAKPADPQKSLAEKEVDFKKRQQEAKEKADRENKEREVAKQKAENCERARNNQATLESDRAISNNSGGIMDDSQRQQELEYTRRVVSESCK